MFGHFSHFDSAVNSNPERVFDICSEMRRDSKECFAFVVDTYACQNAVSTHVIGKHLSHSTAIEVQLWSSTNVHVSYH